MLDWFWKGIAAIAGLAALVFGTNAARTKQRMERDLAEREQAMQRMTEKAYNGLIETRRRHAGLAPIDSSRRTDFE